MKTIQINSEIRLLMRNTSRTKPNDRIGLLQTRASKNSVSWMASLPVTQGFSHLPLPRGPHQVDWPQEFSVEGFPRLDVWMFSPLPGPPCQDFFFACIILGA